MFVLNTDGDIEVDMKLTGDSLCCQGGTRHEHLDMEQANNLFVYLARSGKPLLMPSRETNVLMDTNN